MKVPGEGSGDSRPSALYLPPPKRTSAGIVAKVRGWSGPGTVSTGPLIICVL